jgi:hypothetical protein
MNLNQLLQDLEWSKKSLTNLRNDIVSMGNIGTDNCSELTRFFMEETQRVAKDFRKITNIEFDESSYLKQQVT